MPQPRRLCIVWSLHARVRELERVTGGIHLPPVGSFLRILDLGASGKNHRWVYLRDQSFLYGQMFYAKHYDVFLIKTVISRPHSLWQPPEKVTLYELDRICEQGEEGREGCSWKGYTFAYHNHLPPQPVFHCEEVI